LNFYTTEQLVMLRKELGKFSYTEDCSMLQNVSTIYSFRKQVWKYWMLGEYI